MWELIRAFIRLLLGRAKEWVILVLKKLRDDGFIEILNIAKQAVLEVEQLALSGDWSNEQKRQEAFNRLKDYAGQRGIFLRDSVANYAIELALQMWKDIGWPF
jgi:hypothetical protein